MSGTPVASFACAKEGKIAPTIASSVIRDAQSNTVYQFKQAYDAANLTAWRQTQTPRPRGQLRVRGDNPKPKIKKSRASA